MNARAALVDSWRQIEFVADQLESQFDLVLEGSIGNFGDNPFSIRTETGTLRGGFRFDSPLIRQAERNNYRQTLIRYQQARRNFYRFEDEVNRNLRSSIRGINLNKILFELNRRSVQVNIEQVEQARLKLEEPARIQTGGARTTFGSTVAQDLLRAIQGLQSGQNRYLNGWVAYEVARRNLDFDLGTMQLDEMGRWIDPGDVDGSIGHRAAMRLGIDTTCLDCGLANVPQTNNDPISSQDYYGEAETDYEIQGELNNGNDQPVGQPDFEPSELDRIQPIPELQTNPPEPTMIRPLQREPINRVGPGPVELDTTPRMDPLIEPQTRYLVDPDSTGSNKVSSPSQNPYRAALEKAAKSAGIQPETPPEKANELGKNARPLKSVEKSEVLNQTIQVGFEAKVGENPFAAMIPATLDAYQSVFDFSDKHQTDGE